MDPSEQTNTLAALHALAPGLGGGTDQSWPSCVTEQVP